MNPQEQNKAKAPFQSQPGATPAAVPGAKTDASKPDLSVNSKDKANQDAPKSMDKGSCSSK